jgi:Rifampin ADP-ribosyl transferase/DoxX-like family
MKKTVASRCIGWPHNERTFMQAQTQAQTITQAAPFAPSKGRLWAGRILTALPALFLLMDGVMKLFKPPFVVDATVKLGYAESVIIPLGIVLTLSTILYLIPRTAVLGAILLTGYLGGAVNTHVRIGDNWFNILFPALMGALLWGGLYFRDKRLRACVPEANRQLHMGTMPNKIRSQLMAVIDDLHSQQYYHGTKADLKPGDLIGPGYNSNYGTRKQAAYVYLTATLNAATWGAELAQGEAPGRIYLVEPTGPIEDDPNLTDKKFPGNPTKSYRTRDPLRVTSARSQTGRDTPPKNSKLCTITLSN